MTFLIDENVSRGLIDILRGEGHRAIAVGIEILSAAADETVFNRALVENATIITRDYHFTNPIRFDPARIGGIIYIHHGNMTSEAEIGLALNFIKNHSPEEYLGRLATLSPRSIRIR